MSVGHHQLFKYYNNNSKQQPQTTISIHTHRVGKHESSVNRVGEGSVEVARAAWWQRVAVCEGIPQTAECTSVRVRVRVLKECATNANAKSEPRESKHQQQQ